MVFAAVGMAAGPIGFDFLKEGINAPLIRVLAEITLVLVLFIDASTINLRLLIHEKGVPFRLLLIGLPLTMGMGLATALPLFGDVNPYGMSAVPLSRLYGTRASRRGG